MYNKGFIQGKKGDLDRLAAGYSILKREGIHSS